VSVRDTSILSWQEHKANGRFKTQKAGIWKAVAMIGGMTRRRIAEVTGYELGAVCGAVNGLIEERHLVDDKIIECPTTKRAVHLVELPGQRELAL
jgi:hypothetical protein